MKLAVFGTAALLFLSCAMTGNAAEPLVGTWQLDHQDLNGQKRETEAVTLRVSPEGDKFLFSFSVPVNNIDFVSMSYTAKLDGTEAEVKNARGVRVGTAQVTRSSASHYKLILKGPKRPESIGSLTVSADGNTLTSESDTVMAGHSDHLVQYFSRH